MIIFCIGRHRPGSRRHDSVRESRRGPSAAAGRSLSLPAVGTAPVLLRPHGPGGGGGMWPMVGCAPGASTRHPGTQGRDWE